MRGQRRKDEKEKPKLVTKKGGSDKRKYSRYSSEGRRAQNKARRVARRKRRLSGLNAEERKARRLARLARGVK